MAGSKMKSIMKRHLSSGARQRNQNSSSASTTVHSGMLNMVRHVSYVRCCVSQHAPTRHTAAVGCHIQPPGTKAQHLPDREAASSRADVLQAEGEHPDRWTRNG